jgi:hypothetical protein
MEVVVQAAPMVQQEQQGHQEHLAQAEVLEVVVQRVLLGEMVHRELLAQAEVVVVVAHRELLVQTAHRELLVQVAPQELLVQAAQMVRMELRQNMQQFIFQNKHQQRELMESFGGIVMKELFM